MTCDHCHEEILEGERGHIVRGGAFHRECEVRLIAGSAGHQLGLCTCYREFGADDTIEDPPGLTVREAARAARLVFRYKQAAMRAINRMQQKKIPA